MTIKLLLGEYNTQSADKKTTSAPSIKGLIQKSTCEVRESRDGPLKLTKISSLMRFDPLRASYAHHPIISRERDKNKEEEEAKIDGEKLAKHGTDINHARYLYRVYFRELDLTFCKIHAQLSVYLGDTKNGSNGQWQFVDNGTLSPM